FRQFGAGGKQPGTGSFCFARCYTVESLSCTLFMSITLSPQFHALTELLRQTDRYWRPMAFRSQVLPWMVDHPGLVLRLQNLPAHDIERLGADPAALVDWLTPDLPFAGQLQALCELPVLARRLYPPVQPRFHAGIPGRKWQQVEAFAH